MAKNATSEFYATALRVALARRGWTVTHVARQLGVSRRGVYGCLQPWEVTLRWRVEKLLDEAIFSPPREFAQLKAADARFGEALWTMLLGPLEQLCREHGATLKGAAARLHRGARRRALILALGKVLSARTAAQGRAASDSPSSLPKDSL